MSITQAIPPANQSDPDEIEIRLSDIVQFLKDSVRTVLRWALAALVIGALYAYLQPDQFTSYVTVMPELQAKGGSGLGNLGSLAGLAGISLDGVSGSTEAIRPDLYPSMLQSVPFGLYMLNQPINVSGKTFALGDYLIWSGENSTGGRFGQALFGWLSADESVEKADAVTQPNPAQPLQLTKRQEALIQQVNKRIAAEIDKKSGVITITAKMPDPAVSATSARLALDYLTSYVTSYRTGKSRQQVKFLTQQVTNARRRYEAAEYGVSAYRDRNRNVYLNTAKIEEQRLQADYLLAQGVYNDLAKQLEQARIKVQEEAPVFQVLEPARIPLRKSEPKRTFTALGFAIFGAIVGLFVFFARWFIRRQSTQTA